MSRKRFKLTALERNRILAGNPLPIVRDTDPKLEAGFELVVLWGQERRYADAKTKGAFTVVAKPLVYITVTKITRRRDGKYAVRYSITDERDTDLYLAPKADYTTDRKWAVDKLPAPVSERERKAWKARARLANAERRERDEEARRRQERALRVRLRKRMDELSPVAQQQLLAAVERTLEMWDEEKAA